jgi:hypothetical protein
LFLFVAQFYIIPLTKKLKYCGVFGVSSDEYLSYAEANKAEWIKKGEEIVRSYEQEMKEKYGAGSEKDHTRRNDIELGDGEQLVLDMLIDDETNAHEQRLGKNQVEC